MSSAPSPAAAGLLISPRAAQAVLERARAAELGSPLLRVAVVAGGCNGLSYELYFVEAPSAEDRVFESSGVRLLVDPSSFALLEGTSIDLEPGAHPSFRFDNPRARRRCSCGASFEV